MILCKKIGNFFEKSTLLSINIVIMLAVISLFIATDSYATSGKKDPIDTLKKELDELKEAAQKKLKEAEAAGKSIENVFSLPKE